MSCQNFLQGKILAPSLIVSYPNIHFPVPTQYIQPVYDTPHDHRICPLQRNLQRRKRLIKAYRQLKSIGNKLGLGKFFTERLAV